MAIKLYITKPELAARLGVSLSEIRRQEAEGKFKPTKRSPKALYSRSLVAALVEASEAKKLMGAKKERKPVHFTAKQAKEVYMLLEEKVPLEQIVIRLTIHPNAVMELVEDHEMMTGALMLTGTLMRQINALSLDGSFPIGSGEDLLEVLKNCVTEDCNHCKKRKKEICYHCIPEVAERIADAEDP